MTFGTRTAWVSNQQELEEVVLCEARKSQHLSTGMIDGNPNKKTEKKQQKKPGILGVSPCFSLDQL